ncbi:MAG: PBP1A family penicillin-binding protein [Bdellovibrionales bacterium]|jgi:penicillin-binding protein 1A|nr:PBP1A family penicillin-binding protein [Bdellovibrionales bacterium]
MKKLIAFALALVLLGIVTTAAVYVSISSSLPQILKVSDYKPLLVSDVYARGGEPLGEYFQEVRKLTPIDKVPKLLIDAFIAIEDRQFYEHKGLNYTAILRAFITNLTAGRTRQGASTITQQLAKQLFLSPEKSYSRKLREALLAKKLEDALSKDEILYLYLNQIYFGSAAHGVAAAAEIYFRKSLDQITLAEMAIIAGLPQRPSDYSPIRNPQLAKRRQREVLGAMVATGKITQEDADKAFQEPIKVYLRKDYKSVAPFAVETIRQMLIAKLGGDVVLNDGIRVYTTIDYKQQEAAQEQVRNGLREVDKRQGYRGPLRRIENQEEQTKFLTSVRDTLIEDIAPVRTITPDGLVMGDTPVDPTKAYHQFDASGKIVSNLPSYAIPGKITEALVTKVNDDLGLVYVRFAEVEALLDLADMDWARKPDPQVSGTYAPKLTKPSLALKAGDVIQVRILADRFASKRDRELQSKIASLKAANSKFTAPALEQFAQVALEQEPIVQGSLISFDIKTGETVALVGGYDFAKSEFNRALQAKRQTGSSFKSIVYAAALDKGFTPATPVQDAPIVYEDDASSAEGQDTDIKKWKPNNHGEKFAGDILFRSALVRSLNIPTVKILESIGVSWTIDYARRLGIFSPLNPDLSLGLGSSSTTLYEMTRVFAEFGRLGKRLRPLIVHKVTDREGNVLLSDLSLDAFFEKELTPIEEEYEQKRLAHLQASKEPASAPVADVSDNSSGGASSDDANEVAAEDPSKRKTPLIYFDDADQLMRPQTAYVMTSLLAATVTDDGGTAARVRALGRPAAGKTGSSNGYFDGWFVGYTPQLATGVWVGFDEERSIGAGEVGGRTALPIWLEYMRIAHGDTPSQPFPVPPGIVFANIDAQTGKLASSSSRAIVNQAFIRGTEPKELSGAPATRDDTDFYKEDLAE